MEVKLNKLFDILGKNYFHYMRLLIRAVPVLLTLNYLVNVFNLENVKFYFRSLILNVF